MTEMTKAEFEDIEESFGEVNPYKYYVKLYKNQYLYKQEAIFVSHIAKKWKINENSLGKSELAQYKLGLERLEEFRQLYDLINNLQATYWESRALYLDVTRELATANCWSRREV